MTPAGGDGLRIREVVDIDFGERGSPRLPAPDPERLRCADRRRCLVAGRARRRLGRARGRRHAIRVGDPAVTNTGQHRYVLTYTLPDARLSTGELALDIIGNDETLATERFEIVVAGLDLEDPLCNVGSFGQSGGCDLEPAADGTYRAVIEHARTRATASRSVGASRTSRRHRTSPSRRSRPASPRTECRWPSPWCRSGWHPAEPSTSGRVAAAATRCSPAVPPTPPTGRRRCHPDHRCRRRRRQPLGDRRRAARRRRATGRPGDDRVRPAEGRRAVAGRRAAARTDRRRDRRRVVLRAGGARRPHHRARRRRHGGAAAPVRSSKALAPTSPPSCRTLFADDDEISLGRYDKDFATGVAPGARRSGAVDRRFGLLEA